MGSTLSGDGFIFLFRQSFHPCHKKSVEPFTGHDHVLSLKLKFAGLVNLEGGYRGWVKAGNKGEN